MSSTLCACPERLHGRIGPWKPHPPCKPPSVAPELKLSRPVEKSDVQHPLWLEDGVGDNLLDAVIVTTGIMEEE